MDFYFWPNFACWQIRWCWFQIWQPFFKSTGPNTQIRHFWSHFLLLLLLLLFCSIFSIWIISRALISNMTLVFSNFSLKYSKGFFGPWDFLFLRKTFHFNKFEGADFKYGYSFSNLQPKIIQIRHFWFQVWKYFILHKILLNDIFENADVKRDNSSSKFKPANNPKAFYPKFNVFLFLHENLFWQIWGCWKKSVSLSKSNP